MKTCAWTLAALVTSVAFADSVAPIGWRQTGGVAVEKGETKTITAPLVVGSAGTFVKAGEGTLVMPVAAFEKRRGAEQVVLDGTLKLTVDSVEEPALAVPACFDTAAHWFSAADTSYIVSSNNDDTVWRWFDVRESGVNGSTDFVPTRPFMQYARYETDCPITLGTYNGHSAVYGGGKRTTGGYIDLRKVDNSAVLVQEYVYAAFVVHGVKDSWGNLIGAATDPNDFFVGNTSGAYSVPEAGWKGYYYYRADTMSGAVTARHYRNGEVFDPFHATVTRTNEVLGANFVERPTKFSHMFAHRAASAGRFGADYIHEVVVFTNRLTETEIEQVNRYLMRKYGLKGYTPESDRIEVGVGASGTVEVSTAYDPADLPSAGTARDRFVATNFLPVAFRGEGTVKKTGTETLSVASTTFEKFNGVFKLEQGAVLSRADERFPLLPESGKSYAAEKINYNSASPALGDGVSIDVRQGTKTTVGAGSAKTVTKTGNGELAIIGVPEGVDKVEVKGGTLSLVSREAKAVYAAAGAITATFADPGVEKEQVQSTAGNHCRRAIAAGETVGGWTCPAGSNVGGVGIAVAPLICNDSYFNFEIAEGRQAIYLENPADVGQTKSELYTTVKFPAAGLYRMSWREAQGSRGGKTTAAHAYHVMLGKTWAEAEEVDHRIAADGHYPRVYLLLNVPEAGDYCFGFMIDDKGGGAFYNVTMDDFRADFVAKPPAANVVKIPNGDFEQVGTNEEADVLAVIAKSESPYIGNFARGWTFHQGDNIDSLPSVAVVSPAVPQQALQRNGGAIKANATNRRYSRLADETYGTFSLFMAYIFKDGKVDRGGNNYATTTFKVAEAGTYYLRGKVSRWNISYDGADFLGQGKVEIPSISAKVTMDDAETDLGSLVGDSHLLQDRYWTTPFTVAEDNTDVTLKIEQTTKGAGAVVDDLVLVKATADGAADDPDELDTEYVTNGSFEAKTGAVGATGGYTASSWSMAAGQGSSANISYWINIGGGNGGQQYTELAYDGTGVCCVRSDAMLYQKLPEMKAGTYRFRVAANSRSNGKYGQNGFVAWLEKSGSDPVAICRIEHVYDGNPKVRYFDFEVPEDGTYTLKIQGTVAGVPEWASGTVSCVIDGLSIKRVFATEQILPSVPKDLRITVAEGAKLNLDFKGKITTRTLKLGGTGCIGTVSAATHPDYITGDGEIEVEPHGTVLIFR